MKVNDKVKLIRCSTKQLSDLPEEALAPILGESHNYSWKQGIITSWLPNQFPKPNWKDKASTRPFPTNLEQVQVALNREHGWLISFLTLQSLYTLPTSRVSPFCHALPWCTARITLQDISKAQLNMESPSTVFLPLSARVQHINVNTTSAKMQHINANTPVGPAWATTYDQWWSNDKRVQFTLSGLTHYQPCGCTVCRVTRFKNRSLDLQQEQTSTQCSEQSHHQPPSCLDP